MEETDQIKTEQIIIRSQQEVNIVLEALHKARKVRADSTELIFNVDSMRSEGELRRILCSLPEEIKCLSINIKIPPCPELPHDEIDYFNRNIRELFTPLNRSTEDFTQECTVPLVIRTPRIPAALRTLYHGSEARDLSEQVLETVSFGESGGITLFKINPLGDPHSSPSRNYKALDFLVPLRFVQAIVLEGTEKPLTPYFEREGDGSLTPHPISYS